MAQVDKSTANWRLFGGGGLVVAGVLWLISDIVSQVSPGVVAVVLILLAWLVLGIALLLVAFGQTGSNGAVGASVFGKVSLVIFAAGWILYALSALLLILGIAPPAALTDIAGLLVVVGGVLSAVAIYSRGVAKGVAKWAIIVPVILSILFVLTFLGWVPLDSWVLPALLSIAFALTGLAYLFNRAKLG
jgi:uncharacterized membrane protein HdeD (DUF308 family)